MRLTEFKQIANTLRHLKIKQLYWQFNNRLKLSKMVNTEREIFEIDDTIIFFNNKSIKQNYFGGGHFVFLNLEKDFRNNINWNFLDFGKLWCYNLEYFDYLFQRNLFDDEKLSLLHAFYDYSLENKRNLEPYPVSLRAINIIRFFRTNEIKDQKVLNYLYKELSFLSNNLEYHILGNHLLENAFALCLGGAFFKNTVWRDKAIMILKKQLNEQILKDGAHFELSPMYHNIILYRVLELIDWYSRYNNQKQEFLSFCKDIAFKMCSWANKIQFTNGDFPLFNDAAKDITFSTQTLNEYADTLSIKSEDIPLGESGYRSFVNENYEIKLDLGQIGASYQPGHAHADALSFILYCQGKPLFVEQGTSTYQIGARRNLERSTEAHNTVKVNNINQSDVWGGFRVGNRAKTTIHKDENTKYIASHDGYKNLGIIHTRSFIFEETEIQISDYLTKDCDAKGYVHLHPDRKFVKINDNEFIIDDVITVVFVGGNIVTIEDYEYAESYNKYQKAKRFVVSFRKEISTKILFKSS
ncbi:alginate lyase family protein [Sphingobacterium sp. 18053]|uniref:alginate lyase family protein n=1 Tax=Sphingobacterium sp. 18053 TaxID=2681401 RepID=UPI0013584D72|nr:alginate lyase family protein [Sphingobacterium sp. 18053]